jgi:hypothetical protein
MQQQQQQHPARDRGGVQEAWLHVQHQMAGKATLISCKHNTTPPGTDWQLRFHLNTAGVQTNQSSKGVGMHMPWRHSCHMQSLTCIVHQYVKLPMLLLQPAGKVLDRFWAAYVQLVVLKLAALCACISINHCERQQ